MASPLYPPPLGSSYCWGWDWSGCRGKSGSPLGKKSRGSSCAAHIDIDIFARLDGGRGRERGEGVSFSSLSHIPDNSGGHPALPFAKGEGWEGKRELVTLSVFPKIHHEKGRWHPKCPFCSSPLSPHETQGQLPPPAPVLFHCHSHLNYD